MDKTKPFGAMVFLRNGFPPTPEFVVYVPVAKMEDLAKSVGLGPAVTKKVADNQYEIIGIRADLQVKFEHGYAFIMGNRELLETDFPNPDRTTRGLTSKFDLATTLEVDTIPSAMRTLFLDFVKRQAYVGLQQRNAEPDGLYEMRRAQSQRVLEGLTQVMLQLERLTIGIDGNKEKSQAVLEIIFDAKEGSQLASEMKRISTKRSHFERLIQEEAPFSLSISVPMAERDTEQLTKMLGGAELWLAAELDAQQAGLPPVLTEMFQAVGDSVSEGHADMFLQFNEESGAFSIAGGARLIGGQKINAGVRHLLEELANDSDIEIGEIELDAESHSNVSFHRMIVRDADEAASIFGSEVSVYLGIDKRIGWLAIGGKDALKKTKDLMDLLNEPESRNRSRPKRGPFHIVFNAKQWLGLDADQQGIGLDAFENGRDRMTINVLPTKKSIRLRAEVDEGYLRLIGLAANRAQQRRYDRAPSVIRQPSADDSPDDR
jgi:hypothetical protein